MNFWLKGNVTIPPRPHTVGGLIGWARGVNRALTELRDRKIVGVTAKAKSGTIKPLTIRPGTAADKFQIVPGVVNAVTPTLATVALDNDPPPEITVSADVWVWVKCVGTFDEYGDDTYVITIETSATSSTPSGSEITATEFTSFRSIGKIDFTSGSPNDYEITNYHSGGNLGVDSFGNVNLWWIQ